MNDAPQLVIPGIEDPVLLACIARSRKYKQFCKAVDDALAGRCPFCDLDTEHNKVIEMPEHFGDLRVWHCNPPEKNTRLHFIISPRRHVMSVVDLTHNEWSAVQDIIAYLQEHFQFSYAGLLVRDGDATKSSGTVPHLHIHVMVPDGTGRVESPFCKTPEEEEAGVRRAIVFEKLRTSEAESLEAATKTLSEEEYALVKDRF